jgi:hypothetical protein
VQAGDNANFRRTKEFEDLIWLVMADDIGKGNKERWVALPQPILTELRVELAKPSQKWVRP